MRAIEHIIEDAVRIGCVQTLEMLGVSAGEISQRKAIEMYGKWFKDAVADGRILPIRIEGGKRGAKIFRIQDICAVRVQEAARAELRL